MFEINVDVGRLRPFLADKALKQQVIGVGIDGGDPKAITDGGIGGTSPALAEDALRPGKPDDGKDGEKVWGVAALGQS